MLQIVLVKLHTEKVTTGPHYVGIKLSCTIEHANDFVVDLPVYTEDGWAAGLVVESEWSAINTSSPLADEPVARNVPVRNEVFVNCISELDRQSKERCLFARGRATRLSMLMENRGLNGGLAVVSWNLRARRLERAYVYAHICVVDDEDFLGVVVVVCLGGSYVGGRKLALTFELWGAVKSGRIKLVSNGIITLRLTA